MSDDVARAVGAGGSKTVTIAGKECTARPLTIKELSEVEREALDTFRAGYLKTFSDNAHLLKNGQEVLMQKMEEVARWDLSDLPAKWAYDADRVVVNKKVVALVNERLQETGDDKINAKDKRAPRLLVTCLDLGVITPAEYKQATGKTAPRQRVSYAVWWMTGSFEGMATMIWVAYKHNGVTKDEVMQAITTQQRELAELTAEMEALSVPAAGNG